MEDPVVEDPVVEDPDSPTTPVPDPETDEEEDNQDTTEPEEGSISNLEEYDHLVETIAQDPVSITVLVAESLDLAPETIELPKVSVQIPPQAPEWLEEDPDGATANIYAEAGVPDQDDEALIEVGVIVEELPTYEDEQEDTVKSLETSEGFFTYATPDFLQVESHGMENIQFSYPSKIDPIKVRMVNSIGDVIDGPVGPVTAPYRLKIEFDDNSSNEFQGVTEVPFDVYGVATFNNLYASSSENNGNIKISIVQTQEFIDSQLTIDDLILQGVNITESFVPEMVYDKMPVCGDETFPDSDPEPESEAESEPEPESESESEPEPESEPETCPSPSSPSLFCLTNDEGMHPTTFAKFGHFSSWQPACQGVYHAACTDTDTIIENLEARCGILETCQQDSGCLCDDSFIPTDINLENHIQVQCTETGMKITVDKCAANLKGFSLPDMYLGGKLLSFQPNGATSCHGQLSYTSSGQVYEFNVDSNNLCGSEIDENGNISNVLQAYPGGILDESSLNILSAAVSCSHSSGQGLVNIKYSGADSEMPSIYHLTKDVVNRSPGMESIYMMDMLQYKDYLIFDVTFELDFELQALKTNKCMLSSEASFTSNSFYTIINDGCPGEFTRLIETSQGNRIKFNVMMEDMLDSLESSSYSSGMMFLHCKFEVCNTEIGNCQSDCS